MAVAVTTIVAATIEIITSVPASIKPTVTARCERRQGERERDVAKERERSVVSTEIARDR